MTVVPMLPASGLVRVIYASRWGAGACEDLHHIVRAIVARSIENNRQADVTGTLLVHGGWFVQALEGPAQAVRDTFERIAKDQRHFGLTLIAAEPVRQRAFTDTPMSARQVSVADYPLLERLGMGRTFEPAGLDAERALRLLSSVGLAKAA